MTKNVILGIVAFGGLILVGVLLTNNNSNEKVRDEVTNEVKTVLLPSNLPAGVPVHPHTEVRNSQTSNQNSTDYLSFSLIARTTITEVNEWYRAALSQNGWNIKNDKNIGGYQIIQAENQNLFTSLQAANDNEPGTVIISQQVQIRP